MNFTSKFAAFGMIALSFALSGNAAAQSMKDQSIIQINLKNQNNELHIKICSLRNDCIIICS